MSDGSMGMLTMDVQQIAARTLLCTLNTSAWRATRLHRGETESERKRHNTNAPRVLVTVCEHPALKEIAQLHAKAYAEHRRLTMPTVQDGMRLLPAARQFEHADTMRKLADEHARIVARFLADYEHEAADAPRRLNGLYDASMWPSREAIARRFSLSSRYLACPHDGEWGEWLAESARAAQDELTDRLREALERVRDRCGSDGKLYASVFENLADLVELVPDLNLSGSSQLQAIAEKAEPLADLQADLLRNDALGRKRAAEQAGRLLDMFGGLS